VKKLLSAFLLLAFLVGTVAVTGCGDTKPGTGKTTPSTEKKTDK
jgi:hypothetical protein